MECPDDGRITSAPAHGGSRRGGMVRPSSVQSVSLLSLPSHGTLPTNPAAAPLVGPA